MGTYLIRTIIVVFIVFGQAAYSQVAENSQLSKTSYQKFDSLKPDSVSDDKWLALKAAAQDAKLLPNPSGIGALDSNFGNKISIDNNRALVAAFSFNGHGAVFVLDFNGVIWQQTAVLIADDIAQFDFFGISVSLDGDRALIGAHRNDDNGNDSGSAYIFDLIGGSWSQSAKLTATDGMALDEFGISVSLHGNRALIGSHKNDNTQGVSAGSAYVFDLNSGSWSQTAKLVASDGVFNSKFGFSVSLFDNTALIGSLGGEGSAYIFDFNNISWQQTIKLETSDISLGFGYAVDLDNGRALIGSIYDDETSDASGAAFIFDLIGTSWMQSAKLIANDGTQLNNFGRSVSLFGDRALIGSFNNNLGAAYVFDLDTNGWAQTDKLIASDGISDDFFGNTVSLWGDRVLIGASGDDDNDKDSGSVYDFRFNATDWTQSDKLIADIDSASSDFFGTSVSLFGDRALIGAPNDNNDNSNSTGSAYIFDWVAGKWILTVKLLPSSIVVNGFGASVSLSFNRALIGAWENNNNTGAAFIFDLNNGIWSQSVLFAEGGSTGFGSSVSLENNLAIIGAKHDAENGVNSGAAYISEFDSINWSLLQKMIPTDGREGDNFGRSVSLSGFKVLIGSPLDDENGIDAGAVYVFEVGSGVPFQSDKLISSSFGPGDRFGTSISLDGNQALIGANGDDDNGTDAGAAYLFGYDSFNEIWSQDSKLHAVDGVAGDLFGTAVSLSNSQALISAIFDDDGGINTGSAYVFNLNGIQQIDKFTANKRFDTGFFGVSVALSGDKYLIGASLHDENGSNSGAAYIFDGDLIYRDGFE